MASNLLIRLAANSIVAPPGAPAGERRIIRTITVTPGTTATKIILHNGVDNTGPTMLTYVYAANADTKTHPYHGALFDKGCFAEFISGTGAEISVELGV